MENEELLAGTIIAGKYHILRLIGEGGVGQVYLAKDEKIQRVAAIKLLSKQLSNDADHKARFTREARTISALSHPNIITVYEIGAFNDQMFIATEYVEGQTLREVIEKRPLNLKEFFNVAIQASQALVVAHQSAIIHRDLKLENFILRTDGLLKILDFGLAKAIGMQATDILGSGAGFKTEAGTILGTPYYMSPEQAKGEELDARSDIFSFGAVCYELLSGKLAFDGDTLVHILTALAVSPPPPLPTNIPARLRAIVFRMLQKAPAARYQSMQHVLAELIDLREELKLADTGVTNAAMTNLEASTSQLKKSAMYKKLGTGTLVPVVPQYEQFIGFTKELQIVQTEYQKLGKEAIRPIMILSDSGGGKTQLLNKLKVLATQQELVVSLISIFDQDNFVQPYQWVLPMLAALLGFRFDDSVIDSEGELAKRVSARIKARYNLTLPKEILGHFLATGPDTEKWQIFEVINQIINQLIKDKKVVLLFDNLHWANELTLELIGYLLRNTSNRKILIVFTSDIVSFNRTGGLLKTWFSQQNLYAAFEVIELKPFTVVEIQAYLKAVFSQIEISEQEVNYIYKITNGNPYYLNEVIRLLVQANKIRLVGSLWNCESLEKLTLPSTIGTALLYKIEKCSQELRNLLTQASILGTSFSFDLLVKLTEIEEEELEKLLLEAEKEHLIYEERTSRQDEYYFQSSALQQILYDSVGKRQKKRLHLRAAVAIKGLYFNKLKQAFATLAYHYQMAGELAEAFYFAYQATLILFEQGAWDEVVKLGQLVEEAVIALKESDSLAEEIDLFSLVDLKNKYANALVNLGRLELALDQTHSALEIAEKLSNQQLIAQTFTTMAHLGWFQGRFINIITWAEKGLLAAQLADNKFWQQQLHLQLGRAKIRSAPYKESLDHFVKACELAQEIGEEKLFAQAQAFRGVNLFLLGNRQEGFNYVNEGVALTKKLGDSVFESRVYSMISLMASCEYNFDLLKQMHEQGVKLSQQIGWRIGEIYQHTILAGSYLVDINLDTEKAEYLLQRALALALEVGDKATEVVIRRGLAQLAGLSGDYELAINQIKQTASTLKKFGELLEQTLTLRVLAEVQEVTSQTKEALETYTEALDVAQYVGAVHQEWIILLGQARCLYKLENLSEALSKLNLAKKIIEKLRTEMDASKEGRYFFETTERVYDLLARIEKQIK